jgi:hypothetical protein
MRTRGFAEHLRLGISMLMLVALFLCGCGASAPEPTIAEKPISEPEYLKRATGIVVEVLGDTGRAVVSCEALQRWNEAKKKENPAWLRDVKQPHLYAFAIKSRYVTNFQHSFLDYALNSFVRESPPTVSVVSNEMSRVVAEFLGLRDTYVSDGFDDEWKTNVIKRAGAVYSALSSAISSLNIETNIPGINGLPHECFSASYRSPYQVKRVSITSTGPAPDERMIVEHLLRFDWITGSFHQRVSIDPEERVGNFQLIGPYVMAPLPTIRTNRTTEGRFIHTNLAVVVFLRETNSVLRTVFSDLSYLKDAEFKLGDCFWERKL